MDYLKQPYPYYHRGFALVKFTGLLFCIGFLFEYLIVPFPRDPDEHLYSYEVITLFHIGVAALTYFIYFLILSPFVQDDDWKVYKELVAVFFLLIFIGLGEWAIRPVIYDYGGSMSVHSLIEELWHAQLSGGLIYLLVTLVNVKLLVKQHTKAAHEMSAPAMSEGKTKVRIGTQHAAEDIDLDPSSLICVRADGNYLELFLKTSNGNEKQIKRLTLVSLADQLAEVSGIVKTHRAYLVNVPFIQQIEGNAQGYQLTMEGIDFKVPVSRKHLETFNALVK